MANFLALNLMHDIVSDARDVRQELRHRRGSREDRRFLRRCREASAALAAS
jgi:hypothetical protein